MTENTQSLFAVAHITGKARQKEYTTNSNDNDIIKNTQTVRIHSWQGKLGYSRISSECEKA